MKILKTIRDKDFGLDTPIPALYKEYRAARGIVFDKENNFALLHSRSKNYHKIPGGGIERGEEIVKALEREMLEEIGCKINNIRELGVIEEYWDKLSIHQLSYYFIADIDGEKGIPRFEAHELEDDFEILWVNIDTAIKILQEEGTKTENYRGKFINTRDIFCLIETKKIMDKNTINSAIEFATKKFEAVNKKNHFLRVLAVLQNEFHVKDSDLLIAAILHDTLEDTDTIYEELEKIFSKNVADLVQEVSHPKNYNKEQKLEFYEKLKTISLKAKIIKLADFTDNLRNIILQRKADPTSPYHNQYILWIRDFLNTCPESNDKNLVFELTKELELYVTK